MDEKSQVLVNSIPTYILIPTTYQTSFFHTRSHMSAADNAMKAAYYVRTRKGRAGRSRYLSPAYHHSGQPGDRLAAARSSQEQDPWLALPQRTLTFPQSCLSRRRRTVYCGVTTHLLLQCA